jgi:hypothetical protein
MALAAPKKETLQEVSEKKEKDHHTNIFGSDDGEYVLQKLLIRQPFVDLAIKICIKLSDYPDPNS